MIPHKNLILADRFQGVSRDWAGCCTSVETGVTYAAGTKFDIEANLSAGYVDYDKPNLTLDEFTVCGWFNIIGGTPASAMASYGSVGAFNGFIFGYWNSGKLRFYVRTPSGFEYLELLSSEFDLNKDNFWSQVYDGEYCYIFLNGAFIEKFAISGSISETLAELRVGGYGNNVARIDATVGEFYLFDKALQQSDINRVMNGLHPILL